MTDSYPSNLSVSEAREAVLAIVRGNDSLLKNPSEYSDMAHPLAGHCYVASEAVFHLTGGYDRWYVERQTINGVTHWYLRSRDDPSEIVDLTEAQFETEVDHSKGTKSGFLTADPSNRTQRVLDQISNNN